MRVKILPGHSWNRHCVKTTYVQDWVGKWSVFEDRVSMDEWANFDRDEMHKSVSVLIPTEWYVDGRAYCAAVALLVDEHAKVGMLCRKEHGLVG